MVSKYLYKNKKNTLWNNPKSAVNVSSVEHKLLTQFANSICKRTSSQQLQLNVLRIEVNDELL
ncbi:hypothetical protein SA19056_13570 [Staphylococcus argenteus]|nr:hypothetical protein SA19056_13570 [Staphylococcus argenteus]GJF41564.1 hypothetical protein SA19059_12160 [Staphylococcus argenteus]GJF67426.1 hypothetical protein SA19136_11740 [Staphylococcus argenteus]